MAARQSNLLVLIDRAWLDWNLNRIATSLIGILIWPWSIDLVDDIDTDGKRKLVATNKAWIVDNPKLIEQSDSPCVCLARCICLFQPGIPCNALTQGRLDG